MISVVSHENNEAITDPEFTGWWNNDNFEEIGDQCAYLFGTALGGSGGTPKTDTPGTEFDQAINSHRYYTQTVWSNENNRETQGNWWVQEANVQTAKFADSATSVKTGQSLTFTASTSTDPAGTGLTYSWNLGDGTTRTGVLHAFTKKGTDVVTLTLTDAEGWSASSSARVWVRSR